VKSAVRMLGVISMNRRGGFRFSISRPRNVHAKTQIDRMWVRGDAYG